MDVADTKSEGSDPGAAAKAAGTSSAAPTLVSGRKIQKARRPTPSSAQAGAGMVSAQLPVGVGAAKDDPAEIPKEDEKKIEQTRQQDEALYDAMMKKAVEFKDYKRCLPILHGKRPKRDVIDDLVEEWLDLLPLAPTGLPLPIDRLLPLAEYDQKVRLLPTFTRLEVYMPSDTFYVTRMGSPTGGVWWFHVYSLKHAFYPTLICEAANVRKQFPEEEKYQVIQTRTNTNDQVASLIYQRQYFKSDYHKSIHEGLYQPKEEPDDDDVANDDHDDIGGNEDAVADDEDDDKDDEYKDDPTFNAEESGEPVEDDAWVELPPHPSDPKAFREWSARMGGFQINKTRGTSKSPLTLGPSASGKGLPEMLRRPATFGGAPGGDWFAPSNAGAGAFNPDRAGTGAATASVAAAAALAADVAERKLDPDEDDVLGMSRRGRDRPPLAFSAASTQGPSSAAQAAANAVQSVGRAPLPSPFASAPWSGSASGLGSGPPTKTNGDSATTMDL